MDGVDAPPLFLQHSRRYGQKADLLSICWIMTQNPQIFGKLRAATLTFVEAHICMSTPAPHAHAKVTERGQDSVCLVIIDAPRGTQKVGLSPTPSTMSSTLGGGRGRVGSVLSVHSRNSVQQSKGIVNYPTV